ncbi:MAG: hypothetical protein JWP69_1125 [Flaviaesturariibacter sp.]|nr:hypothetical protein [Flaviaesturariibacter sp.]
MKYWLLTTEYPPFFGGGISTYCQFTAKMLAEKGHGVSVFINDTSVSDVFIADKEGVRLIRFNPSQTNASSYLGHTTNLSYEFAHVVKKFVEEEGKPDIIEAQEYLGIAYYLLQYKYLLYNWCKDVPVVITMHSPSFLYLEHNHVPLYKYPNYWIGEMERYCMQAADLVISPSAFLVSEVKKRFDLTSPNIVVVPNPYHISNNVVKGNEKGNQIIFFGKLSAQKGIFKLLHYFHQLWDQGFTESLYLIGGQDIVYHPEGKTMGSIVRSKYKSFISRGLLKLEDKISPNKIKERLNQAKLVIIPSTVENLPYVLFEMMEIGKIVLVSKQGGHAEVVKDGSNGFVFDHNEPQSFFQQLAVSLSLSNEERNKIGAAARETIISNYSLDTIYALKLEAIKMAITESQSDHAEFPFIRSKVLLSPDEGVASHQGLLSIVVPYYNMGKYIDETIQSLEATTYLYKEIIIINDGSTDVMSIEKLKSYEGKVGIIIYSIPNNGLANARNYGAQMAKGEYIAYLDADDTVKSDYYKKAIAVLTQYSNVHFVGCWTQYFEGSSKVWPTFTPEAPIILYHNTVNSSALVCKRNAFMKAGLNDRSMAFQGLEDYESVVSLISSGYGGVVLPEILFDYRVRQDSMIRGITKTKKLILYQHINNKHKEFYAIFAAEISNLLSANGPGIFLDNPSIDYHLADKIPFGGQLSNRIIHLVKKNKLSKQLAYKLYRLINK